MRRKILLALTIIFYSTLCFAAQTDLVGGMLKKFGEKTKIILIEPDVEVARVLASGQTELRADWSEAGTNNTTFWIKDYFSKNDLEFDIYSVPDGEEFNRERQVKALHRAVGISILNIQTRPLPTKETFNWTLGKGTNSLKHDDADYGLFIYLRRGYGTGGRIALSIASAVLFGAAPVISYQFAFASLVDLETGKVVWFNNLAQIIGDLREKDGAEKTIRSLLTEFPQLDLPEPESLTKQNCVAC